MNTQDDPGMTPFTLQDFPGVVACIVWFSGCNFRCSYCHNPELVNSRFLSMAPETLDTFLKSRVGKLGGVVFSGGECTLSPRIFELARIVKQNDLLLKIDTNGSSPEVLAELIEMELIDSVAMDFKAPFADYGRVAGWSKTEKWRESFALVQRSNIAFEVRTTVHPDLLSERDVSNIMYELNVMGYRGFFYLQNFREGVTLGNLGKPSSRLDPSRLPIVEGIQVRLRNFN
ncbi:anaerobic ribonucleoside-triphosphate reductase activating protein [Puniceicoccaceae bacterium K14]|nr:anaerobic ribonucleoside-triphosphate reductase activating protein [Puniceicoccaceae bacterium K14]